MFCPECGTKNPAENNFCRQCGHKVESIAANKISEADFTRALPEDEQVAGLMDKAYRLRSEKNLPEAVLVCREALALLPDSTSAHSLLGQLQEESGNHEAAITEYRKVLELNPGSIADRMKLDDLLKDPAHSSLNESPPPRVHMIDRHSDRVPAGVLAAGFGILVLLLGGVLALILNTLHTNSPQYIVDRTGIKDHGSPSVTGSETTNPQNNGSPNTSGIAANSATANNNPMNSNATTPNKNGSGNTANNRSNNPPVGPSSGIPLNGYPLNYIPYPVPTFPNAGMNASNPPSGAAPPANSQKVKSAALKPNPLASKRNNNTNPNTDSARIHLPSPPDEDKEIINITVSKGGGNGIVGNQGSANPANTGEQSRNPATSEAQTHIQAGQDRMNKMDYSGAITALRLALPNANDDSGFVYQLLGQCYQEKQDNKNGLFYYQHGKTEYKRLMDAGRQSDQIRNGIRICENGIKICTSE